MNNELQAKWFVWREFIMIIDKNVLNQ